MPSPENPEAARLGDAIRRLHEGDPTAPADLAAAALPALVESLARANPTIDVDLLQDAAHRAVLSLIQNPSSYDPDRSSPTAYLRMSAQGDLRNLLRSEAKHRHVPLSLVEQSPIVGNYLGREEEPLLRLFIEEAAPTVPDGLSSEESRALKLIREGERRTAVFSEEMGWTDLPADEQRARVKKLKDRLKKRVKRAEEKRE